MISRKTTLHTQLICVIETKNTEIKLNDILKSAKDFENYDNIRLQIEVTTYKAADDFETDVEMKISVVGDEVEADADYNARVQKNRDKLSKKNMRNVR